MKCARRLAAVGVWLVACSGGGSGEGGEGPRAPPITDADFTSPWVLRDRLPSGSSIETIAWGTAGFVAITHRQADGKIFLPNDRVAISVDGLNWAELGSTLGGHFNAITFANGRYFAAGGMAPGGGAGLIVASNDGKTWTMVGGASAVLRHLRHTPGGFIAVGMNGVVVTSPDGATWTESVDSTRGHLQDGNFGMGRFVAAGMTVSVATPDGRGWTLLTCESLPCNSVVDPSGIIHHIFGIATLEFGNGFFLADGQVGVLKSTNALSWQRIAEARSPLTFAAGRFLTVDGDNVLSDSVDGQSWTARGTVVTTQTLDLCGPNRCFLLPQAILLAPAATRDQR